MSPPSSLHGMSITPELRGRWLEEHEGRLGASEAAVAIGIPGFNSQLNLYLRKCGKFPPGHDDPDRDSQRRMRFGLLHEPTVAQAYLDEVGGSFVGEQIFLVSDTHPFMCATLDRIHSGGRVVEFKTTGERQADQWGEPYTDEVPHDYLVQVLHQLHCAKMDIVDIAVLIGLYDFRVYTVRRKGNERTLRKIVDLEGQFMRAVATRRPPPADPERDAGMMAYLFPDEVAEPVALTREQEAAWDAYEEAGRKIVDLKKGRDRAKIVVAQAMGEHTHANLGDGRVLTRKVVEIDERRQTVKAYRYPLFRAVVPKRR